MITKETADIAGIDFESGASILIDKPRGITSFNVVYKIRKAIKVKKVGHAGTLDPLASGLLIVCTGRMTKQISQFQDMPKTYEGIIILGKESPSMDLETEPIYNDSWKMIAPGQIIQAAESFKGKIMQVPPMFSALKAGGKSLYKFARKGRIIERAAREVTVFDFKLNKISPPEIHFVITCSKGTYIRVIAHDLGKKLGCGGLLGTLRRTQIGSYSVANALSPDEFKLKFSSS
jgi:tRNA pseudouridine55 synthase